MALATHKDTQTKEPKPFRTKSPKETNPFFLSFEAFPDIHQYHHDLLFFSVAEQIIGKKNLPQTAINSKCAVLQ